MTPEEMMMMMAAARQQQMGLLSPASNQDMNVIKESMMDTGGGMYQTGGVSAPIPMNIEMPVNKTGMFDTGGGMFMNAGVSAPIPTGAASNVDMELFNNLVKSNPYGLDYDTNTGMFFYGEGREPMSAADYQSYIDDINRQQQEIYSRDEKPINTIMNKAGDAVGGLLDLFR